MESVVAKYGFCIRCRQNVMHERLNRTRFWRRIDSLTFRMSRFTRLGPWSCCQCYKRSAILRLKSRAAPNNRVASVDDKFDAVHNYIRSDQSILLHQQRSARYSQKFRDGIVTRLTSENATLSQICRELMITEADLIKWIADLLDRKQLRIDELSKIVNRFTDINVDLHRIESSATSENTDDGLFEGGCSDPAND